MRISSSIYFSSNIINAWYRATSELADLPNNKIDTTVSILIYHTVKYNFGYTFFDIIILEIYQKKKC